MAAIPAASDEIPASLLRLLRASRQKDVDCSDWGMESRPGPRGLLVEVVETDDPLEGVEEVETKSGSASKERLAETGLPLLDPVLDRILCN